MGRPLRWLERRWRWLLTAFVSILVAAAVGSFYLQRSPADLGDDGARVLSVTALAEVFEEDVAEVEERTKGYWVGQGGDDLSSPAASWRLLEKQAPGLSLQGEPLGGASTEPTNPFVYEAPDAPHLVELRETYHLDSVIEGADDEYEAQLALGAWVGTRFAHGLDELPEGEANFDPTEVVRTGMQGKAYWCEIASKVTIYAAASLGWPARLATASRDGVTWEHALAELWSNQHRKWFVLDTDYNQVYEVDGRPLSAYELCHDGLALQKAGRMSVRFIAPQKPGVDRTRDMVPYYEYTHIDMRNDWRTRLLRRGSPAGGDRSTWWTARPSFRGTVSLRPRVDDQERFDWPVNRVELRGVEATPLPDGRLALTVGLRAYVPYFRAFQLSLDRGPWQETTEATERLELGPGEHTLRARVVTVGGHRGPIYDASFIYNLQIEGPQR